MNNLLVIDSYSKHQNLKLVADELGMSWQNVYVILKKNKVSVIGNKSVYGSNKDKLASKAESIFKSIIPYAIDNNLSQWQPKVDFDVNGLKVDVKSSLLHNGCKSGKYKRWSFSVKKQEFIADYIVAFGFNLDETYNIFLFPNEFIRYYQTISINENMIGKWASFKIHKDELKEFFDLSKEPLQGS